MYYGDIRVGQILYMKFSTTGAGGVPIILTSGAVKIYQDDATGTEVTTGVTLSANFDSLPGLNTVKIDTADAFYAAGHDYFAVLTGGTVEGSSVIGMLVGSFSIENRSALMPTTAARKLDVTAGGEAGIDWSNVGSPTTTLNLSGTTVSDVSGAVGSVTGAVGSVTGLTVALIWAQVIETGFTATQSLRLILAALAGKLSGAATTSVVIRDVNDAKNRISATVDADGNRTAVTTDVT